MASGYYMRHKIKNVRSSQTVLSNAEHVGESYKQFSCLVPEGSVVQGKSLNVGVVKLMVYIPSVPLYWSG